MRMSDSEAPSLRTHPEEIRKNVHRGLVTEAFRVVKEEPCHRKVRKTKQGALTEWGTTWSTTSKNMQNSFFLIKVFFLKNLLFILH